jgi:hypothetical protein
MEKMAYIIFYVYLVYYVYLVRYSIIVDTQRLKCIISKQTSSKQHGVLALGLRG